MERIVERPGALDVHKASVTACVRVWEGRDAHGADRGVSRRPCTGCWRCVTGWRRSASQQVVMEATGVYWKPVWAVLEDTASR